jgi:transglutaminase-like putative cysteine protease
MDFMHHEGFTSEPVIKSVLGENFLLQETPLVNAKRLSGYVYENFEYKKGVTNIETTVDEILKIKAGVCQDFAHLLLVMLQMTGIPARYVSGYICPGTDEMRGTGATHAWVEAYIPFYGWLGLDPTNNCIANKKHVRLAVGRNFSDCTPVKGTYKGSSEHELEVSVQITNGENAATDDQEAVPLFSYTSQNPAINSNSYLQYLEMQQQQQ